MCWSAAPLIAHGEVVVVNDKFGIRLTDVISQIERIKNSNDPSLAAVAALLPALASPGAGANPPASPPGCSPA